MQVGNVIKLDGVCFRRVTDDEKIPSKAHGSVAPVIKYQEWENSVYSTKGWKKTWACGNCGHNITMAVKCLTGHYCSHCGTMIDKLAIQSIVDKEMENHPERFNGMDKDYAVKRLMGTPWINRNTRRDECK